MLGIKNERVKESEIESPEIKKKKSTTKNDKTRKNPPQSKKLI